VAPIADLKLLAQVTTSFTIACSPAARLVVVKKILPMLRKQAAKLCEVPIIGGLFKEKKEPGNDSGGSGVGLTSGGPTEVMVLGLEERLALEERVVLAPDEHLKSLYDSSRRQEGGLTGGRVKS